VINKKLEFIKSYSSGVKASGKVNPNSKKGLEQNGAWNDSYHSKTIDKVMNIEFDLVVTVCDNAKESCPVFPKDVKVLHVGFEDPDGKEYEAFNECYKLIEKELLPIVKEF
jgi:arsenate reductase